MLKTNGLLEKDKLASLLEQLLVQVNDRITNEEFVMEKRSQAGFHLVEVLVNTLHAHACALDLALVQPLRLTDSAFH